MTKFIKETLNKETLNEFLISHGVDTHDWGTGILKPIDALLKEIHEGESLLKETENGRVERIVYACSDDVYYRDENNITWKLKEERRVMSSGAVRIMNRGESVRGKMKEGEKPEETIKREIQEELDIPASGYELRFLKVGEYAGFSTNYATLFSRVTQYYFEAYLKKESYHPEGYLEKTPDYTSYFIWEKKIKTVLG